MKCPNCTNELPEQTKVCGYCGVKIISPEKFLCPSCGEELPAGVKVCGFCGTKLEKPPIVEKDVEKPAPMEKSTQQESVKAKHTRKVAAKTEPIKAEKKSKTPPKVTSKKAGMPKWVLPGFAGVVIVALALVYFFILRPSTTVETDLPAETSNKEESYTYVYWGCDPMTVSSNDQLAVYHYWLAKEEGQVDDYIDAMQYSIAINEKPWKIQSQGVGDLEQDPEGVKRRIWLNIGTLPTGEYEIETSMSLREPVFDGFDWFGPGTDYPGTTKTCQITVE